MPKEIKRWKCNHCKKNFASKKYAERHEKICFFNPELKTCPTCFHFNSCFKNHMWKCDKLKRNGYDKEPFNYGEGIVEIDKYNVFTEFLIYNCEHWESEFKEVEDEDS